VSRHMGQRTTAAASSLGASALQNLKICVWSAPSRHSIPSSWMVSSSRLERCQSRGDKCVRWVRLWPFSRMNAMGDLSRGRLPPSHIPVAAPFGLFASESTVMTVFSPKRQKIANRCAGGGKDRERPGGCRCGLQDGRATEGWFSKTRRCLSVQRHPPRRGLHHPRQPSRPQVRGSSSSQYSAR